MRQMHRFYSIRFFTKSVGLASKDPFPLCVEALEAKCHKLTSMLFTSLGDDSIETCSDPVPVH